MQFDPLNDALIKMYNAEQAGKFDVELAPASKLLGNVLEIMQKSGYVGSIERQENGRRRHIPCRTSRRNQSLWYS